MARGRRDPEPRSSPDPQQRQSRQRRVSAPWDNTLCLNISHQPTLIYSGNLRRGVRSPSIFSPTRRESPSQSRSNLGRSHPGNPLGNPRNSQGSARLQEEVIDHVDGLGGLIHQIGEQLQLQLEFLVPTANLLALLNQDQ